MQTGIEAQYVDYEIQLEGRKKGEKLFEVYFVILSSLSAGPVSVNAARRPTETLGSVIIFAILRVIVF